MARSIVQFLLLLFLAAIGVNWPELPYNARLPDLIFVPLAVTVMLLPRHRWTWRGPDLAVAIYLLGALPAILVSTDRWHSAIEFAREIYLVIIYVIIALATRQRFARTIGTGLATAGAIISVTGLTFVVLHLIAGVSWPAIGEVMQLPYLGDTLRLWGLAASPAMLACVLTAAVPFAITLCGSDRVRGWCALAAMMMLAAALTFSHALAGFSVAVLVAAWRWLAAWPWPRRLAIAGAIVIFLGLNFAATVSIKSASYGGSSYADASQYFYGIEQGTARIGGATVTYTVMSYARIKQVAWRAFTEHPIAGIGLDRFHVATVRAFDEGLLTSDYRVIDPHSTLIGRLAETGLIGAATLLVLWGAWAGMARAGAGNPIGFAAGAALAGLLVASVNADIMNFRFVWVIAGLLRGLQDVDATADPNASTPLNDHGQAPR